MNLNFLQAQQNLENIRLSISKLEDEAMILNKEPILTFRKQTRNYDFCGVKHKNLRPCL
ncbi:hypothetical protein CCAND38_330003 [Capnocytophaga canis]|uniref:Uncharacterized protein n=1 Tax=Capnocytophaga canis TaxID=1848903 RepID=A0A0B7I6A3_9FLAO|nr:hypothetical protein CCAND38_330003 [Capnocytophaga canis]